MANWSPIQSVLLSQLLDDVVGTDEMVQTRQDYCKILDYILSITDPYKDNWYYTGSKAEGLDLPGSDMFNMNNLAEIHVIQSMRDARTAVKRNLFCMRTKYVQPCFALLRSVDQVQNYALFDACQLIYNAMHLSSC